MSELKVGDKVRIKSASAMKKFRPVFGWNQFMNEYCSQVFEISHIEMHPIGIELKFKNPKCNIHRWQWGEDMVTKVIPKVSSKVSTSLETFDEIVQLPGDVYAKKISRKNPFILPKPIQVYNRSGHAFFLVGFMRVNKTSTPKWLCNNGRWYTDEYFYVKCDPPKKKMTVDEIEKALGYKVEIISE